jgi:hypothetical protein
MGGVFSRGLLYEMYIRFLPDPGTKTVLGQCLCQENGHFEAFLSCKIGMKNCLSPVMTLSVSK